jgi:hypothetical protein
MYELLIAASQMANAYVPLNLLTPVPPIGVGRGSSNVSEKIGNRVYQI